MANADSGDGITIYFEPQGCNCAKQSSHDRQAIHSTCVQALNLARQGEQVGRDKYPHAYKDNEHFSFKHAEPPYFEFPIMSNGEVYGGDRSTGTDRVVIGSVSEDYSSAVYCATVTHSNSQERSGFVECRDDTVNPEGEGAWDTSLTEGKGLAPPSGRRMLKAEDVKVPWTSRRQWLSNES